MQCALRSSTDIVHFNHAWNGSEHLAAGNAIHSLKPFTSSLENISFQGNGTLFLSRPDYDDWCQVHYIVYFRDVAARNKSVTWVILVTAYRLM